jgi:uridylate kinase
MSPRQPFKRVLLKLSGEALKGNSSGNFDFPFLHGLADEIHQTVTQTQVELAIVIGGGNFIRGEALSSEIKRTVGDYMGMLATLLNALAMQAALEERGLQTRVLSGLEVKQVAELYIQRRAVRHLEKGRIVIFAAGTGNPFFTTDTGAALRGAEIGAQVIMKATNVDGVYTADPRKDPQAQRYESLTFTEALNLGLRIMDASAFSLCAENQIPVLVFNLHQKGNILRAVKGEPVGTLVTPEPRPSGASLAQPVATTSSTTFQGANL